MLNPLSFSFPISDSSGDLNYTYTTPTTQPLDTNASCPPSRVEYNSGLIGCALALVDLTTADEVGPVAHCSNTRVSSCSRRNRPSLSSAKSATPGQVLKVSNAKSATTYWWLATLATLEGDLGGASAGTVSVGFSKGPAKAANNITVTPASYNGSTFTPPVIAGGFTVPNMRAGYHPVTVTYTASLEGLPISVQASAKFYVKGT